MTTLSRRSVLLAPVALAGAATLLGEPDPPKKSTKMVLCMHQNTSVGAGYRKSLEGWAKAGIKYVELQNGLIDDFLKTDTLAAAKAVFTDLGLTAVQGAAGGAGYIEPTPNRAAALENLKRRCDMYAQLGINHVYVTTATNAKFTADDYKTAANNVREIGDIAKQTNTLVRIEFMRSSTFCSTLRTLSGITREANHPNVAPLLDCYHFWSAQSKFEDLEATKPGEIGHVHFTDTPDMPRELLDNQTRAIPGDGVTPLMKILQKLSEKGYSGPLSVELFLPKYTQGDPFAVAQEIRQKAEAVMHQARVI
jgi:2-keto-myo-inositol isomerase